MVICSTYATPFWLPEPFQVKSMLTVGGHNAIYVSSQPTAAISTMQLGFSKLELRMQLVCKYMVRMYTVGYKV